MSKQDKLDFEELKQKIDLKDREILTSIYQNGGRAVITEIRADTGISTDSVNYRLKKKLAERYGLVTIERVPEEETNKPSPPKIGVLSEYGRAAIEQGGIVPELYQMDDTDKRVWELFAGSEPEDFDEALERIDRLESRVNAMSEHMHLVKHDDDLQSVKDQVDYHTRCINHLYTIVEEIATKVGITIESEAD